MIKSEQIDSLLITSLGDESCAIIRGEGCFQGPRVKCYSFSHERLIFILMLKSEQIDSLLITSLVDES